MNDEMEGFARLRAWARGHAVHIRGASAISSDEDSVLGLAFIRVVGEERTQALAVGVITKAPTVLIDWEAFSHTEAEFIEPLAYIINEYVSSKLAAGCVPRIWVSDNIALSCIELLGRRYHRNPTVSNEVQRLGWICEALNQEVTFSGQQALVLAVNLIRQHIITGQSAIDDLHLDALLAWLDTPDGTDPSGEAERRALVPLASMLARETDERVDRLRSLARRGDRGRRLRIQGEIEGQLRLAVLREWRITGEKAWHIMAENLGSL